MVGNKQLVTHWYLPVMVPTKYLELFRFYKCRLIRSERRYELNSNFAFRVQDCIAE